MLALVCERCFAELPRLPGVAHALRSIIRCRTLELGGKELTCPDGHEREVVYASCSESICPICAGGARRRAVAAAERLRLDCPVLQIVVTLDPGLKAIWHANRRTISTVLMRESAHAVEEMMADEQVLGARPGIIATLHTGSLNSQHVHVHLVVTRGGLTPDGRWRDFGANWTMSYEGLAALVRGKVLAEIKRLAKRGSLFLPAGQTYEAFYRDTLEPLYAKSWNTHIEEANGRDPMRVIKYVTKGAYKGPVAERDIVGWSGTHVTVRTVARDGKVRTITMPLTDFARKWAWHVMPKGCKRVRYYALYAAKSGHALEVARQALGQARLAKSQKRNVATPLPVTLASGKVGHCGTCGQQLQFRTIAARPRPHPSWQSGATRRPIGAPRGHPAATEPAMRREGSP